MKASSSPKRRWIALMTSYAYHTGMAPRSPETFFCQSCSDRVFVSPSQRPANPIAHSPSMRQFRSGVSGPRADVENTLGRHSQRPIVADFRLMHCSIMVRCRKAPLKGKNRPFADLRGCSYACPLPRQIANFLSTRGSRVILAQVFENVADDALVLDEGDDAHLGSAPGAGDRVGSVHLLR